MPPDGRAETCRDPALLSLARRGQPCAFHRRHPARRGSSAHRRTAHSRIALDANLAHTRAASASITASRPMSGVPIRNSQLERFSCLPRSRRSRAARPGRRPRHTFGTVSGRRRLRIQAAIARPARLPENRNLTVESENRTVYVRLLLQHARIVDQISGRKTIGPVNDDVIQTHQLARVGRVEPHRNRVELRSVGSARAAARRPVVLYPSRHPRFGRVSGVEGS